VRSRQEASSSEAGGQCRERGHDERNQEDEAPPAQGAERAVPPACHDGRRDHEHDRQHGQPEPRRRVGDDVGGVVGAEQEEQQPRGARGAEPGEADEEEAQDSQVRQDEEQLGLDEPRGRQRAKYG
jgi:hypothetical protein